TVAEGNTAIPEQTRYLRAERLGHDLWIPESAIRDITMAGGVVVDCTKDECIQRYSTKPNVV
ncbi:MAG: hypothetical protein M3Z66_20220, partial [Chloroflexota bacterium]|nr:hypothetical protein [Chloroflexota bacterium]